MDPEIRRELDEIHALVRDNHRMLRAVRRRQWLGSLSTIIVWILVLALPLYLYQQYLEPIIAKVSVASGMSTTTTSGFLGLPTSTEIQNLINSLKAKL
ncbi:MAG: hypothetical protein ABSB00_02400 [Minisyncoccia bacterium]|jgi:hypothetical protein